ncbi:13310_t:CDS:2 [Entrophospora sp. SA101]|nr:13310_t:CDS:2 [Entrophospora sp. SA101]
MRDKVTCIPNNGNQIATLTKCINNSQTITPTYQTKELGKDYVTDSDSNSDFSESEFEHEIEDTQKKDNENSD